MLDLEPNIKTKLSLHMFTRQGDCISQFQVDVSRFAFTGNALEDRQNTSLQHYGDWQNDLIFPLDSRENGKMAGEIR